MARVMRSPGALPRSLRLAFVFIVVAGVVVAGAPVRACSCVEMDLGSRLPEADGAFVGTYVDRDPLSDGRVAWTFVVERVIKGPFGPTAIVRTSGDGASCGIELFDDPRAGLLLDRANDGVWESSLCQQVPPNQLLAFAQNSHPPVSTIAPIGTAWSIESKVALVGALVVVLVALLALAWSARRRRAATTVGSDVA
jgi:hypothetical protein